MSKLYEIAERYNNLQALLEDESIDPSMLSDALSGIEDELTEKVQSIAKIIISEDSFAAQISEEIKRLQKKLKSHQSKSAWLQGYLLQQMEAANVPKIDGVITVKVKETPGSVEIVDPNIIPTEYCFSVTDYKKGDILKALRDGVEVPGCQLKKVKGVSIK